MENLNELLKSSLAKSNLESIREHTDKVHNQVDKIFKIYGDYFTEIEKEAIHVAAEYHDYGKLNYAFQKKIHKYAHIEFTKDKELEKYYYQNDEVPHGYLSPAFIDLKELSNKFEKEYSKAILNAIYFHHVREKIDDENKIENVVKNEFPNQKLRYLTRIKKGDSNCDHNIFWLKYALIKGVLNRADYAASSNEDYEIEESPYMDGIALCDLVEEKMSSLGYKKNSLQCEMQEKQDRNVVAIASTGAGKTEAACLWSGGDKLFYTLPLKVSINAIYQRLSGKKAKEYGYTKSTLLHSDALSVLLKEEENEESLDALTKYRRSSLFTYPLTVCTVDQLFTFVYKYQGSEMIPATLSYSKVVIDEIQAYTPDIIAKLIYGLKIITQMGGKFAIITATFPPVLEGFLKKEEISFEKTKPFLSTLNRHKIKYYENDFDYKEIISQSHNKKVLVICNTIKKANTVYECLKNECDYCKLLHSRFELRHKRLLENKILEFAESNKNGIWITTQIVEASLDIDFDVLYTEMCPADSLLQRMGRCYRKREYIGDEPNVIICDSENGKRTIYKDPNNSGRITTKLYDSSVNLLKKFCDGYFTEQQKIKYINDVYSIENCKSNNFFETIETELNKIRIIPMNLYSLSEAKGKFRDINSESVMCDATYNELLNSGEFDRFCNILEKGNSKQRRKALDELMDYTVSINPKYFKAYSGKESIFKDKNYRTKNFTTVYRTQANYDFDEENLCGRGLTSEMKTDNNFL